MSSIVIKSVFLLLGAFVIAAIVRIVVIGATHRSEPVVVTEKVRVSAADLPIGLLMRDADVDWKTIPVSDAPSNAIVADAPGMIEVKGALLRHAVAAGTPLTADDVILPNAPGFLAATLKPGMRAASVAVDDVSGNAGLIQPGDYVDLLLTQQMTGRTESPDLSVSSETVVERVRVLAVGSEIQRPKDPNAPPDPNNRARTVTLEVTPRMAEVVAVAARLGSLSLSLQSFATESRNGIAGLSGESDASGAAAASQPAPVWAGDISRAMRQLPRASGPSLPGSVPKIASAQPVVVYRGSDKGDAITASAGLTVPGAGAVPPLPSVPAMPVTR
jgi:pilus assembly protein CpaB